MSQTDILFGSFLFTDKWRFLAPTYHEHIAKIKKPFEGFLRNFIQKKKSYVIFCGTDCEDKTYENGA